MQKLEQGGVRAAFMSAVEAAALRNEELGKLGQQLNDVVARSGEVNFEL